MAKKKVTLEEAKEILDSDKIFYNGNSKFNVLDLGKYNSGITIEIPQEWTTDMKRRPESPIKYISNSELTDGMNIDFDGDASFLLGKYRLSKNGRPVFELTEPDKAKDILIKVSWGGAFTKTRGNYREEAENVEPLFFTRRSSNGGGSGNDFWILPVNFVYDMEPRNVSSILEKIKKNEDERISKIDDYVAKEDLEIQNSIQNRTKILNQIQPILQSIQNINPEFKFESGDENFTYYPKKGYSSKTRRYSDNLVNELKELLQEQTNEKKARDTYLPMFKEMENIIFSLDLTIKYYDSFVSLKNEAYSFNNSYSYSQEQYNSFVNDLTNYQKKLELEQEEARRKAEELRKSLELKIKKSEAQKNGYPETFEFWNRLGGATNLGHAFVVESDGTIREPDYNNLRNSNHRHHTNWKNSADGTQGYQQILPGEIIVTYTKAYTAAPYILNVEWADSEITEEQKEVLYENLKRADSFAQTIEGDEITDIKQWLIDSAKAKSIECRKQLILEGNTEKEDDEFTESIIQYANQKVEETNKNKKAQKLKKEYEEEFQNNPNNPSLEDN